MAIKQGILIIIITIIALLKWFLTFSFTQNRTLVLTHYFILLTLSPPST